MDPNMNGTESNGDAEVEFNPYKANAYSENVKFDIIKRTESPVTGATDVQVDGNLGFNPEISMKATPPKEWEIDVKGLISTKKWLHNYGLKKNRLDMNHILQQIGFKHSDEYDQTLKKPICSRYGNDMFKRFFRSDGKTFNIACGKEKLKQIESRLVQAICLYKRRLEWLTSESRRIFGVVEEKSITVILDIKNMSPQQFDQYRTATERVLKEQFGYLAKFNLIRATEDMVCFKDECIPTSGLAVDEAIQWLWNLERTAPVSKTATCEAVMKAVNDVNSEAVYIFTEGSTSDGAREILKEKLTGVRIPVHIISYNCSKPDTIRFLKDLAKITGGRFHAYAVVMEMDSYEGEPLNENTNQANVLLKKKTYGGVPPGAGMRDDVIDLFEELEKARSNLAQVQGLMEDIPDPSNSYDAVLSEKRKCKSETYMSSREWLENHGIKSKKLGFYDILAGVAFKHTDGVVDLKEAPHWSEFQTDAVTRQKLVNAKYCDKFPHVRWKDGEVVHVQVTPEIHRNYEQRMMLALEAVQQRIDWLQQGSRELFGTVIEDQINILVDTSGSMEPHIQFVKDKLFVLMQEQLRHKQKFNIICFDSKVNSWRDRLMDVTEKTLNSAWTWIKALACQGSTNTLGALRHALSDPQTQAIYLLTDGRPDQPPKSVLAQLQLHPQVPVHTISFNCADREANEFLCQLAKDTGGRFHYYSENGIDPMGPDPWESEDIRLLKQELALGYKNLEKIARLRDECAALSWRKEDVSKKCSRNHHLPEYGKESAVPPLNSSELYRSSFHGDPSTFHRIVSNSMDRPKSAPPGNFPSPPSARTPRPATARNRPTGGSKARSISFSYPTKSLHSPRGRVSSPKQKFTPRHYQPMIAGHTRTSLLRTLSTSGQFESPEWLLPETRDLFDQQWERQQKIEQVEKRRLTKRARKSKRMIDSKKMSSKKWLSLNGLAAKKLTILDALSPTFIPHKPKYIPILNKNVSSKVFDEIMPYAHASSGRKSLKLVNPQGVNLEAYEERVQDAVDKINKRLDTIVWNALPQDERKEFESDEAVSFSENKLKLMQALDRCGWPIREHDVILLENEIKQGELFIQQSKDLREADAREISENGEEKENYERAASVASNGSQEYEGLGDALDEKQVNKTKNTKMNKTKQKRVMDLMRGQKIIGKNNEDGFYYPGMVIKCTDTRHALVEYWDLGKQRVPTRFVIPMGGAIARPILRVGDYVLSKVINQDTGMECYIPGVVQLTPKRFEAQAKFYTVVLYTGQQEHFMRSYLVKISKMRYTFLVRYIEEVTKEKDERASTARSRSSSRSRSHSRSSYSDSSRSRSSRSRSSSYTRASSYSRSRSRSGSRSRSRSGSRSESQEKKKVNIVVEKHSKDETNKISKAVKTQRTRLEKWQRHLERQQKKQEKQQRILKKQSTKLKNLRAKLRNAREQSKSEDNQQLLERLLEEVKIDHSGTSTSNEDGRTGEWVKDHSGNIDSDMDVVLNQDGNTVLVGSGQKVKSPSAEQLPPPIFDLRQYLTPIDNGEEVLARWSDEGWYYRGIVRQNCGDLSYFVEDSVGDLERIWREDIIADKDDADAVLEGEDTVIALHPSYSFSYAPGVVLEGSNDLWYQVRFYDGAEVKIPRDEIYKVQKEKFELDVSYILKCEDQWVGQAVVARNDTIGIFQLAAVRSRIGTGRQYQIEWSDGKMAIQSSPYIFGAFTKRHPLAIGDRVLALADHTHLHYLPGVITGAKEHHLVVRFCDHTISKDVQPIQCFWLSQEYFDAVVSTYKTKSSSSRKKTVSYSSDY